MKDQSMVSAITELHTLSNYLNRNTCSGKYLLWLANTLESNQKNSLKMEYQPIVEEELSTDKRPFATIITRTQGRRPESLRETLLCLYAQTCQDFEVILIGHILQSEQKKLVDQIIDEQPNDFRSKIRFYLLDHGTRTTPLNFGFAHARGKYVIILDDDDLVFGNWIEAFRNKAHDSMGKVLHAFAFSQKWSQIINPHTNETALRAEERPEDLFCAPFDIASQLSLNKCPLIGLAFPSEAFIKYGFLFDEKLTTTEDWDYLMRVAFMCGVEDITIGTCIYRLWINAESSLTVHSQAEWRANYEIITDKFVDVPILLEKDKLQIYATHTDCIEKEVNLSYFGRRDMLIEIFKRTLQNHSFLYIICRTIYRWFSK